MYCRQSITFDRKHLLLVQHQQDCGGKSPDFSSLAVYNPRSVFFFL